MQKSFFSSVAEKCLNACSCSRKMPIFLLSLINKKNLSFNMIKIPLKSCHLKPFYNFIRHQSSNYNRAYFELFNKSQTDSGDTHTLKEFSHVKSDGTVNMVGTISKPITSRVAEASCSVNLGEYAYQQFKCNVNKKGDVASVAKIGKT